MSTVVRVTNKSGKSDLKAGDYNLGKQSDGTYLVPDGRGGYVLVSEEDPRAKVFKNREMASESASDKNSEAWSRSEAKKQSERQAGERRQEAVSSFYDRFLSTISGGLYGNDSNITLAESVASTTAPSFAQRFFVPAAIAGLGAYGFKSLYDYYNAGYLPTSYDLTHRSYPTVLDQRVLLDNDTTTIQQPDTTSNSSSRTVPVNPEPEDEKPDNKDDENKDPEFQVPKWLWETRKNSLNSSKIGRNLRNFGIRLPVEATAVNFIGPVIPNGAKWIATGEYGSIKHPFTANVPGWDHFWWNNRNDSTPQYEKITLSNGKEALVKIENNTTPVERKDSVDITALPRDTTDYSTPSGIVFVQ